MKVADLPRPAPDGLEAACLAAEGRVHAFEARLADARALGFGHVVDALAGLLGAARLELDRARHERARAVAGSAGGVR